MNSEDLPSPEELAALLPQYRFECLLAEGGMGAVYRAEQISLGRPVAIKILPRSFTADATYRDQFKSEARLMGSLNYPHIVGIHDFGEAGDVLYIVMELLEGTNLHQRMSGEPLKQPEIVKIMCQVCDALTAAHHKGVVHRDVKPENIFIEPGLHVKLGDFGIARQRRSDMEAGEVPQAAISGVRLGTPEYAAPELFDFQKHIDHRADIFSLGVVLYELLTGARPTGAFLAPSKRKPGLDKRFDDIVIRAMQFEPGERYVTAEEMKKQLLRILSPAAQPAAVRMPTAGKTPTGLKGARPAPAVAPKAKPQPAPQGKPSAPPPKRKPVLLWSGIGGIAAAVGVAVVMMKGGKTRTKEPAEVQLDRILEGSKPPPPSRETTSTIPARPDPPPPPPRELGPPGEKITFGGHAYQFIPSRMSWDEAKAAAEKAGGHLACVTSQEEYDALRTCLLPQLKQHSDGCWLGASDAEVEGKWKWVTGEPFEFVRWASDAPSDGKDSSGGKQNYLAWQRQSKYGARLIEWNDVPNRWGTNAVGGYLIEWEKPDAAVPPPVVTKAEPAPKPSSPDTETKTNGNAPAPAAPSPSPVAGGWQPVTFTEADLAKTAGRVVFKDGWYVFNGAQSVDLPSAVVFTDGAVRVRLRAEPGARNFQIKPRYTKGEALLCGLDFPSTVRVVRQQAGAQNVLAVWQLATPIKEGDEILFEMRIAGTKLTVLVNGITAGSVDTSDASPGKGVRIYSNLSSFSDLEWMSLDGVTDCERVLTAPSAWPAGEELTALLAEFAKRRDAIYGAPLEAGLKPLRKSYTGRLREHAAKAPAEAAVYNSEAATISGGGEPPATDAPGTPKALADLRGIWRREKALREKALAAAAGGVWSEHLNKLQSLSASLRQAGKHADLAGVAQHVREAEEAVARFTALAPAGAKPALTAPASGAAGLKRPSIPGRVIAWRRGPEGTHDLGAGEVPPDLGPVVAIAAGPEYGLALRPDGTVVQWGTAFAKHVEPPAGLADVVAIDAGVKFAAALRSDGTVAAWGFDYRGNLVPPGLKPAVAISCGEMQGYALHADGSVSHFGWPAGSNSGVIAMPPVFAGIKGLDASREMAIAVKADGTLVFAGSNTGNQISGVPARMKPVSLVASGGSVTCALAGDMLYFWGRGTGDKDADYGHGSYKFPAAQINASPFSNFFAARNAAGEWKLFGSREFTDFREAARRVKGALDLRWSKSHFLALVPEDSK